MQFPRLSNDSLRKPLRAVGVDGTRKFSKTNLIVFPSASNERGPEPTDSNRISPPVRVLDCVRDAQAYRWLKGVHLDTIRKDLGIKTRDAERIVREGVQALRKAA